VDILMEILDVPGFIGKQGEERCRPEDLRQKPPGRVEGKGGKENLTTLYTSFVRLAGHSRAAFEFRDFENTNRNSLKKYDVPMDESPA